MQHAVLSLSSDCAAILKIWKRTFPPSWPNKSFFAETMKTVRTANDRKFVPLSSEISKTQENVKAMRDVVETRFTFTSRSIDQLTRSLNFFDHCVVHTKHFSNLVFKVENYTSYLDLVYTHFNAYRSAFVSYRTNLFSAVSSLSSGS